MLVNVYRSPLKKRGGVSLDCSICLFPWYRHTHYSPSRASSVRASGHGVGKRCVQSTPKSWCKPAAGTTGPGPVTGPQGQCWQLTSLCTSSCKTARATLHLLIQSQGYIALILQRRKTECQKCTPNVWALPVTDIIRARTSIFSHGPHYPWELVLPRGEAVGRVSSMRRPGQKCRTGTVVLPQQWTQ